MIVHKNNLYSIYWQELSNELDRKDEELEQMKRKVCVKVYVVDDPEMLYHRGNLGSCFYGNY